jgi:hypothetical protein
METERIGIREFRENLAGYLESRRRSPLLATAKLPRCHLDIQQHSYLAR